MCSCFLCSLLRVLFSRLFSFNYFYYVTNRRWINAIFLSLWTQMQLSTAKSIRYINALWGLSEKIMHSFWLENSLLVIWISKISLIVIRLYHSTRKNIKWKQTFGRWKKNWGLPSTIVGIHLAEIRKVKKSQKWVFMMCKISSLYSLHQFAFLFKKWPFHRSCIVTCRWQAVLFGSTKLFKTQST